MDYTPSEEEKDMQIKLSIKEMFSILIATRSETKSANDFIQNVIKKLFQFEEEDDEEDEEEEIEKSESSESEEEEKPKEPKKIKDDDSSSSKDKKELKATKTDKVETTKYSISFDKVAGCYTDGKFAYNTDARIFGKLDTKDKSKVIPLTKGDISTLDDNISGKFRKVDNVGSVSEKEIEDYVKKCKEKKRI